MAELIAAAIALSLTLYAVLGGADFGAALVEPFLGPDRKKHVDAAIAPVWEANHVWLVLAVVLAFVGFPRVYTVASTYLHIPLALVLVGIVGRGAAFTFRHYDPNPGRLGASYSWVFRLSSLLAPFFLGVTFAALAGGRIRTTSAASFGEAFVAPWTSWFCMTAGLFTVCLFAFEGAALLAAEHRARGSLPHLNVARAAQGLTIVSGGAVLLAAAHEGVPVWPALVREPLAVLSFVVATLCVPLLAWGFHRGRPAVVRLSLGAQVLAILGGFFATQAPVFVRLADAPHLTLQNAQAPAATLSTLLIALGVGLLLIVPAMAYLLVVYKRA
jgi:cytochrome d ubiquinol oxidase subunit II